MQPHAAETILQQLHKLGLPAVHRQLRRPALCPAALQNAAHCAAWRLSQNTDPQQDVCQCRMCRQCVIRMMQLAPCALPHHKLHACVCHTSDYNQLNADLALCCSGLIMPHGSSHPHLTGISLQDSTSHAPCMHSCAACTAGTEVDGNPGPLSEHIFTSTALWHTSQLQQSVEWAGC